MIPLFVDCSGRQVIIFGGGEVAYRKALFFLREAGVTVVSRSFGEKIAGLDIHRVEEDLSWISEEELDTLIDSAFLVVAALSNPDLNNRIGRHCRRKGILFNNADGIPGDVIIPSVTPAENYTLAITTGGSSPAISRFIREHLEAEFPAMDAMIALQNELREKLRGSEPLQRRRNEILREILQDQEIWDLLKEDPASARERVLGRYIHG
ncbi:MAG: Precorrin-2 dehydrogenase [Methanoregula sp. SKADARSKE-2]|nr:MAG: Precorrin-2 dehydrogenase [Methanoregula sp. SKADARSKE-2]